jgi:hypothetical protein
MSQGPPSRRALADAIPVARQRGTIQMAGHGPEKLYDFTIVSVLPVVFVRVSYCAHIHAPVTELAKEFKDSLDRLCLITKHESILRELWLRSRHGTWRYFRLFAECLVELGRDGQPLAGRNAASV